MLFEMLALKPAFDANNLVSLFYKIVKGEHDVRKSHMTSFNMFLGDVYLYTVKQEYLVRSRINI